MALHQALRVQAEAEVDVMQSVQRAVKCEVEELVAASGFEPLTKGL
jgi:hypothetical protein